MSKQATLNNNQENNLWETSPSAKDTLSSHIVWATDIIKNSLSYKKSYIIQYLDHIKICNYTYTKFFFK
jgi:hypothetical protein